MKSQLQDLILFLVRQQFARHGDIITDRLKEQQVHIKSSGRAINEFIALLSKNISLILDEQYVEYLEKLNEQFSLNVDMIHSGFLERISRIEPEEIEPYLTITFFLGELLGSIRKAAFTRVLNEIKSRLKTQLNHVGNEKKFEHDFNAQIEDLYERNDSKIALIYNLSFLIFIAEGVRAHEVKRTTKIVLGKYMNRLIRDLSKKWSDH